MCDPLSVIASTLTAVGFAAQSCQFLSNIFYSFYEAPKDLQHHIAALHALQSTFADIAALQKDIKDTSCFTPDFCVRLEGCITDFQVMERRLKSLCSRLEKGNMHRTWIRVKWSSIDQIKVKKFLARVESYHTTFSLDLLLLNIRLVLPRPPNNDVLSPPQRYISSSPSSTIHSQEPASSNPKSERGLVGQNPLEVTGDLLSYISNDPNQPFVHVPDEDAGKGAAQVGLSPSAVVTSGVIVSGSSNAPGSLSKSFPGAESPDPSVVMPENASQSCADPISIRSSNIHRTGISSWILLLWLGPITTQQWTSDKKPYYDVLQPRHGYGVSITMATSSQRYSYRTAIALYFLRKPAGHNLKFSIQCELSLPAVVPREAQIIYLAQQGDLDAMKREFDARKAAPTDVLPGGTTLLHVAAMHNHIEMVAFLLRSGAGVNSLNDDGESPLHFAVAKARDYDICRLLLENGADLSNHSVDGKTPLHTFFNDVVHQVLTCHGNMVDMSAPDNLGMTILHYLAWSSKTSCETFSKCCKLSKMSVLLADDENRSALHFAAQRGNQGVINYMFSTIPQLDVNRKDSSGSTPLHYAVESRRGREIVDDLLSRGADTGTQDSKGRTALHRAAMRDNRAALERLLAIGTHDDLRTPDRQGLTPMQLAMRHGANAVMAHLTGLPETAEIAKRDPLGKEFEYCHSATEEHHLPIATVLPHRQSRQTTTSAQQRPAMSWPLILRGAAGSWEPAGKSLCKLLHRSHANVSRRALAQVIATLVVVVVMLLLYRSMNVLFLFLGLDV